MWLASHGLFILSLSLASLVFSSAFFPHNHSSDKLQTHGKTLEYFEPELQFPSLVEYKEATVGFFQQMAAVGHGDESVVVFGAMSLWNHFPHFRYTPDIDINIYEPDEDRLQVILEKMELNSNGKLSWDDCKDLLWWKLESGQELFIDIGYVPFLEIYGVGMTGSASKAGSITSQESIPFASPEEMFVIKICASGRRLSEEKAAQDVLDAEFIAESMHQLTLVGDPIDKAFNCFQEFLPKSIYTEVWWYRKFGLTLDGSCNFEDWFASGLQNLVW